MGRKGTPFPHLQFMAQSVPPPQIVTSLGKKAHDHCQGPKPECRFIGKRVVDFILVIIERLWLSVTVEALRGNID